MALFNTGKHIAQKERGVFPINHLPWGLAAPLETGIMRFSSVVGRSPSPALPSILRESVKAMA